MEEEKASVWIWQSIEVMHVADKQNGQSQTLNGHSKS